MTKTVVIDEKISNEIQKAHIEQEALANLLNFMINSKSSSESIDEYYKKYVSAYKNWEDQKKVIPQLLDIKGNNASWTLDYNTHTVTIIENE